MKPSDLMEWEGIREGLIAQQFLHSNMFVLVSILGVVKDIIHLCMYICIEDVTLLLRVRHICIVDIYLQ